jgi:hypothetical protein
MSFFGNLGSRIFPPGILAPTPSVNTNSSVNAQLAPASQKISAPFKWQSILIYLIVILIIVFIVLLLIDRYITPVFKFKAGGPGFIPIPRRDDGTLLWQSESSRTRDNSVIANMAYNYSMSLDILIHNPAMFSQGPRLLFWRGPPLLEINNLSTLPQDYNIAIYLSKDTNDLTVSIMNSSTDIAGSSVNATLANVPTLKPFRIAVVVMDKLFEVYMNGRLAITKPLLSLPRASYQFFNPPTQTSSMVASLRNLHVWPRPLNPSEIRDIQPSLSKFTNFDSSASSSCFSVPNIMGM